MRQEITVQRPLPVNLESKDLPLFQDSLEVSFARKFPIHLKNVWVLQDTVFAPGELKFYSQFTHVAGLGKLQFAKRAVNCVAKSWRKIPLGLWVIDEWSANYFHWMADCLPRIWEGWDRAPKAPILLPYSYQSLSYVGQSLALMGADVIYFKSNQNLHVDTLILTARTAPFPNFNRPLTQKTREILSLESKKAPWRKVYISRKLAEKRKAHNENQVELLLQKKGIEVVYAENLNLSQQIQLMSESKLLISLHGAALTNMLFLPPSAKVLELRNENDAKTQCYFNMSAALGLSYYYTLNKGESADTITSNFTIDLEALESTLNLINQE